MRGDTKQATALGGTEFEGTQKDCHCHANFFRPPRGEEAQGINQLQSGLRLLEAPRPVKLALDPKEASELQSVSPQP